MTLGANVKNASHADGMLNLGFDLRVPDDSLDPFVGVRRIAIAATGHITNQHEFAERLLFVGDREHESLDKNPLAVELSDVLGDKGIDLRVGPGGAVGAQDEFVREPERITGELLESEDDGASRTIGESGGWLGR
jgi:hypothetical protein